MKKLLLFHEIDRTMGAAVGGKGANLGEMTRAGFPVPEGFCLTTEVYRDFIEDISFDGLNGVEIRKILHEKPLPAYIEALLTDTLAKFPADTLFSVRSSATAEDLPFASFAGQQDTYLNVAPEELYDAIRNCFASLFTDRAVEYRKKNSIGKAMMSVVVQRMIKSEASGILFSADPVSGKRHIAVIDAGFGLGEALVSGLVIPDHYSYDKRAKRIVSKDISVKKCAIIPLEGGGTQKIKLESSEQVLNDQQITELAEIGSSLEAHYRCPQDVEWAVEDGKLYILQTRAITSLYPIPPVMGEGYGALFCINYQQMYLPAMPKLALDMFAMTFRFNASKRTEFNPPLLRFAGNRMFLDVSSILSTKTLRAKFPEAFAMMEPLIAEALKEIAIRDVEFKCNIKISEIPEWFKTGILRAYFRYEKGVADGAMAKLWNMTSFYLKRFDNAINAADTPCAKLDAIYENICLLRYIGEDLLARVIPAIPSIKTLNKIEHELLGTDKYCKIIMKGLEGNVTTEMGLQIGDLADQLQIDPSLMAEFKDPDYSTLISRIESRDDGFRKDFASFMKKYGFRVAGEINISCPRWEDDPEPLAKQIVSIAETKPIGTHRTEYAEKVAAGKKAADEFVAAVEAASNKKQAKEVRNCINMFRDGMPLREYGKYVLVRNFGIIRPILLQMGRELVDWGCIDSVEDVFHFTFDELYREMKEKEDMHALIDERKEELAYFQKLTPPRVITTEGECLMGSYKGRNIPEGALPGTGVSAGVVEGIAKVVLNPADAVMEHGKILVAPFTDPGWTTLFINAAALVTEVGGMLTHGAVVAREYGMPAVVGVADATKLIKTGQRIKVDGSTGYVQILEE